MTLSWCDRLASTAAAGFSLTPHFATLDAVRSLSPILDPMVDAFRNPTFSISEGSSGGIAITTRDGFLYHVDHSRVSVAFNHRMKATPVSGGPPIMEMLSTPLPYTELLSEVSSRLVTAARLLPGLSERKIFQVGIVSTTRVAYEDELIDPDETSKERAAAREEYMDGLKAMYPGKSFRAPRKRHS